MTVAVADRVEQVVAPLRAAVDALAAADLSSLSGLDVAEVLAPLEEQRRRLDGLDARLLAELDERGVAGELGRTSCADVLRVRLRVGSGEARARVRRAREIGPRRSAAGEVLPPLLPASAAALAAGGVSGAHVDVIADVVARVDRLVAAGDGVLPVETVRFAEMFLLEAAVHGDPLAVRRAGQALLARLDPDGDAPDEAERRRGFDLIPTGESTMAAKGRLTGVCAALWQAIFDVLAAPRPTLTENGVSIRDERTATQRRHDAMEEVAWLVLRSGALPDSGGVPAGLIVTVGAAELARAGGVVRTAHGDLITTEQILALAGELDLELAVIDDDGDDRDGDARGPDSCDDRGLDAALTAAPQDLAHERAQDSAGASAGPAVPDADQFLQPGPTACASRVSRWLGRPGGRRGNGVVLALGRTRRIATAAQRKAVAARDGAGCSFPGCTRPLAWCQAHHVVRWEHGGRTDLANLVLVCGFHHRLLDAGDWQVTIARDGHATWIPPAWLDPLRQPLRNREHHPPEICFGSALGDVSHLLIT